MPVSISIEPGTGLAHATAEGVLRVEEARASVVSLWSNPDWSGRAAVWDFRKARLDITPDDVRRTAEFILQHQPATPPAKVAFVTGREVDFGMARMFGAYREDQRTEFQVFRNLDEALRWARE